MTNNTPKLALYHYIGCGFCRRVTDALSALRVDIGLHNILEEPARRLELQQATGRTTVPVLRISTETEDIWMPESADIINYLYEQFG